MKIFNSEQIKAWDEYTINEQGIQPIDLMQRAAATCLDWLFVNEFTHKHINIFCGQGNNGGDGLALAALLIEKKIPVSVYILEHGKQGSENFRRNLQRLQQITKAIYFIQAESLFPSLNNSDMIIDALFGTGLNRPLDGISMLLVQYINTSGCTIISIDMPSGLFADKSTKGFTHISATHTLSFQHYKLAFLFPENGAATGNIHLLDIGLSKSFESKEPATFEMTDIATVKGLIIPRNKFSHKGNFGHAALIAGSEGMMGAALLSARACLASGAGKLTCFIPAIGYTVIQTGIPEAMCKISGEKFIETADATTDFTATGIGPGLGIHAASGEMLQQIFRQQLPGLVLDADALNCLSEQKLVKTIPAGTLITPHPKEFGKLFGDTSNDFAAMELGIKEAAALNIYILMKGHYSAIITPHGKVYFNDTGNAGMAKAGMGDALTGLVTGLLAQKYPLPEAAILGTWLHGLAGDIAAEKHSQEAMCASDLINCIGAAWKSLQD